MNTTIQKWGNSLAVRIPKVLAEEIKVTEGNTIEMRVEGNSLVLRTQHRKYRLSELLKRVTPDNRHEEVDWGKAQGKEQW